MKSKSMKAMFWGAYRKPLLLLIFTWCILFSLGALSAPVWAVGVKVDFDMQPGAATLKHDGLAFPISLKCPGFTVDGKTIGLDLAPSSVKGRLPKSTVEVSYAPIPCGSAQLEVKLFLQWSAKESILRKWAEYKLTGMAAAPYPLISEIMLERLDTTGRTVKMNPWGDQSYPAYIEGFFCGIEYPFASTRLEDKTLILGHRPGLRLKADQWHTSRKAIYGVAPVGEEKREFLSYVTAHAQNTAMHINYNSWWTSSAPYYTEAELLRLMKQFEENLYKPYGASFDSYTIDMGWANNKSIWQIDPKLFPQGFTNLQREAAAMKTRLGLWISPCGNYPQALDQAWAQSQGYETFPLPHWWPGRFMCLAGERYRKAFNEQALKLAKQYDLCQFKLDGVMNTCMSSEHGHEPGPLSYEAIADAQIDIYASMRKAGPDVWLEACAWGWDPSPWWLFHNINSYIGSYGDDVVFGRVPSPVYRESYTSSRDFYNLQAAALADVPIAFMAPLGIVHQSDEDFMNDAVTAVMRGSMFLSFYVNPSFMNDLRWKNLAGVMNWARKNASITRQTVPLLPATWIKEGVPSFTSEGVMPREPYGFVHWKGNECLIEIRNPWIVPATYALKLDRAGGAPAGVKELSAVSLYPEIRLYGKGLGFGDTLNVPLAPYETVVLSLQRHPRLKNVPSVAERVGGQIRIVSKSSEVKRIDPRSTATLGTQSAATIGRNPYATYEIKADEEAAAKTAMAISWTDRLGQNQYATRVKLEADLFTTGNQAQVCILLEGGKVPPKYAYQMKVNGRGFNLEARPSMTNSHIYNLGTLCSTERHWVFLVGRLPQDATSRLETGNNKLSLELIAGDNTTRVAAWVWATRPGGVTPDYPNALPSPEMLSVDGATLMEPVTLEALPASMAKK